jgi:hypothetical protein
MTNKNEVTKLVEEFQENHPEVHVFQRQIAITFTEEEYDEKSTIHLTENVKKMELGDSEILLFTEEKVRDRIKCSGIQISGTIDIRIWLSDINAKYHFRKTEFFTKKWMKNIQELLTIE